MSYSFIGPFKGIGEFCNCCLANRFLYMEVMLSHIDICVTHNTLDGR